MRRPAVYLIGAGPGDPGLITVRGRDCLQRADVVIHDHLIPARLLAHARAEAEIIDVGTAAPEALAQEAISLLVLEKAREGKVVARLKWGDPFVFDKGGEEALFLHEQGLLFEVVPGIPAGIGVPAYAGVPVTYPGGGNTLTLVRGYEDERRALPDVDWASLVSIGGTIVWYVGAPQIVRVIEELLAHKWPADDAALIIYNGTTPAQHTRVGTLPELLAALREHTPRDPAILVIGRVVGFHGHLRWYDTRPLFGRRVLITRPSGQSVELAEQLEALGAETIEAPMIRISPPQDPEPLRQAAANAGAYDWIVFTSVNAVEAFMDALLDGGRDVRALAGPRLCAVGDGTARRLSRYGIRVDLVPDQFRAEAIVRALASERLTGARVLLPRAHIGREVVAEQLRTLGAAVTEVVAYQTLANESLQDGAPDVYGLLLDGRIDVVTFTSASAVRSFVKMFGDEQSVDLLKDTTVAVIGPVTADVARQLGLTVSVQPSTYSIPALVDAIAAYIAARRGVAT